ncbi:MAG: hypothetical protein K2R98_29785 [Gemmataceae bacterium]|nr:hypothetical protein [Gemmataceae bacterium]
MHRFVTKEYEMGMPSSDRPGDRHKHRFLVRLPEIFRDKLRQLRDRTGRPMTQIIWSALRAYLKRFGLWNSHDDKVLEAQTQP